MKYKKLREVFEQKDKLKDKKSEVRIELAKEFVEKGLNPAWIEFRANLVDLYFEFKQITNYDIDIMNKVLEGMNFYQIQWVENKRLLKITFEP